MPSPEAQRVIDEYLIEHGDALAELESFQLYDRPDRPMYFDRKGVPITMREWGMLMESLDYRRVAWTEVGPYFVSTVWLGLNHNFFDGPPVIFETMVFSSELSFSRPVTLEDGTEILGGFPHHESHDERRYHTEEEAVAGHVETVEQVQTVWEATRELDPRLLNPNE